MPPVTRGTSPMKMKADGFIASLNEARQTIKKYMIHKKKLIQERDIYKMIMREQQLDIDEKEIEIFFLKFSPKDLSKLMAEVNEKIIKCKCMACYECGRTTDAPFRQSEGFTCIFAKKWEGILDSYNISYSFYQLSEDEDEPQFMHDITHPAMGPRLELNTDIVNVGYDNLWRNVAYGRGLARDNLRPFSKSRNKLRHLFDIITDYRPDEQVGSRDASQDEETEDNSPVIDMSVPHGRALAAGPVMLGRS